MKPPRTLVFTDTQKPITWKEESPVVTTFLRAFGLRPDPRFYVPAERWVHRSDRDHDEPRSSEPYVLRRRP